MKFEWHAKKAESNLKDHGVSFEEAATVFNDSWQENFPDPRHSFDEIRYICLGMSDQNRVLFVSYTERNGRTRIISAREATNREEGKYYEARSDYLN
jgi:hypothetical protein